MSQSYYPPLSPIPHDEAYPLTLTPGGGAVALFQGPAGSIVNNGSQTVYLGYNPAVQQSPLAPNQSRPWDFSTPSFASVPGGTPGSGVQIVQYPGQGVPSQATTVKTYWTLVAIRSAAPSTEAAITLAFAYDDAAEVNSAGPFVTPANLTRHIQSVILKGSPGSGSTLLETDFRIRKGAAGTPAGLTSPTFFYSEVYSMGSQAPYPDNNPLPDGIEFQPGESFLVTTATGPTFTAAAISVAILGYDYSGS